MSYDFLGFTRIFLDFSLATLGVYYAYAAQKTMIKIKTVGVSHGALKVETERASAITVRNIMKVTLK